MATPTDTLLAERGKTHGDFTEHAAVTQGMKRVMQQTTNYWDKINEAQRESLDMIVHKIGRILSGDPNHLDHWDDIAGYARLISQRIMASDPRSQQAKPATTGYIQTEPKAEPSGNVVDIKIN